MTTGKIIALTIWTFVSKVMSLLFNMLSRFLMGFPGSSDGKEFSYNSGDLGSIPSSGRSPGEATVYRFQYSYLGNPRDRGTWKAIAHGIAKSQT